MTLNGVMALMLRYFTEFGSFRGALRKVVEGVVKSLRSLSHLLMSFLLWSHYGIGQTIIFSSCGFFLSSIYLLLFLA